MKALTEMILLSDLGQAFGNLRAQKTRTLLTALGHRVRRGLGDRHDGDRRGRARRIAALHRTAGRAQHPDRFAAGHEPGRIAAAAALVARAYRNATSGFCRPISTRSRLLSARRTLHPAAVLPKPSRDIPELYGVRPSYSAIHSLQFAEGRFFDDSDDDRSALVCVLGEAAKVNMLGYDPAVGKFVKVNDTWLEVVGVLKEQLMAGSQSSGGTMQDINNIIYIPAQHVPIPLLGPQREHARRSGRHRAAAAAGRGQHRSRQGGDGGAELDASRYAGFHRDDSGRAAGAAAAHADDLHLRDGGDRGDFAAGGRHRDHEHRAGDGAGADAGDRHPALGRRAAVRHRAAVPDRIGADFGRAADCWGSRSASSWRG